MDAEQDQSSTPLRRTGFALLRALRSTLVIAAIALTLFALRNHDLGVAEIKRIALRYSPLWVLVFVGVLFWDYWFDRSRRRRP